MDTDYPAQLRENSNELSQLLFDEETVETTLQRVGRLAVYSIEGCDVVGVTLAEEGRVLTKAATDELAMKLDFIQYDTDEGPCLDSLRRERSTSSATSGRRIAGLGLSIKPRQRG